MPTLQLTDEELEAVRRYFSTNDIRSYMDSPSNPKRNVPLALADAIKAKVDGAQTAAALAKPKSSNPRGDVLMEAIRTASR